jgi:hypothetical protein
MRAEFIKFDVGSNSQLFRTRKVFAFVFQADEVLGVADRKVTAQLKAGSSHMIKRTV